MQNNWFERNPRKTTIFTVLACFLLMIAAGEKILGLKRTRDSAVGLKRFIRLREQRPFLSISVLPDRVYDSLIQKKYRLRVDENGFIMPSKVHENPDITIVFLGGSSTECTLVDEENRFPYLSARLLEAALGIRVNSYNGGVSGSNSLHSLDVLLNKVIPLQPDIVVLGHNCNDLTILLYEGSYWNNNPDRSPIVYYEPSLTSVLRDLKNIFIPHIYAAVRDHFNISAYFQKDSFRHIRGKKIIINKKEILNDFKMNLRTFIQICRIRDITPVLMTQENRLKDTPDALIRQIIRPLEDDFSISYQEFKEVFDLFNQAIRQIGEEDGVLVIDLASQIPQEKKYIYDVVHFNDYGSRLAAQVISSRLKEIVKQKRKQ